MEVNGEILRPILETNPLVDRIEPEQVGGEFIDNTETDNVGEVLDIGPFEEVGEKIPTESLSGQFDDQEHAIPNINTHKGTFSYN